MPKRKINPKKYVPQIQPVGYSLSISSPWILAGAALIAIAAFLAYFPSINGGFILDDDLLVTSNKLLKAPDGIYRFWFTTEAVDYWPVTNTTLWIEWRLWGMNPTGYHITNLILHIVESLLIWVILRKLSIPGAFLAALIFALHPVNVESVAWISQRKNVMAMLFFLLSILWYLKVEISSPSSPNAPSSPATGYRVSGHSSLLWYWLSLAAFVLAMLSKGSVAMLPVLLLGIVWWLRPLTRRDVVRIAPFFLVAVVLVVVNVWFQTHGTGEEFRTASFVQRLLGAGGVVWFYLYKALLPFDLVFIYPRWDIQTNNPLWWLALLAAVAVTGVLWRYRESWSRPFLFTWGFFCVALVPVMGFTDVGFMKYSLVADRYQHIAIIGVIALAAADWSIWHQGARGSARLVVTAVAVVVVGTLTLLTWQQCGLYRDPITLYAATLKKYPNCWITHTNLGNALLIVGQRQEAIEQFRQALRIKSDYLEAHNNLGSALLQAGRLQEAIEHYKKALLIKPNHAKAHYNIGLALYQTGQHQDAIQHFEQALRLDPNYAEAHYNLGNALNAAGQYQQAIEHYQKALRLDPDLFEVHNNLGAVLILAGRPREAIEHCKQALRFKTNDAETHYNLGIALYQTGQHQEAIQNFQQALRLKPDYAKAHYNLGNALNASGQYQQAIEQYQQTLKLKPDYTDAHNNLGIVLFQTGRPEEAIEQFKQVLHLSPGSIKTYNNLASAYASINQSSEAIAAAQKALELARSQGQTALAKQIEGWLNTYRTNLSDHSNRPATLKSAPPPP